jgi:hypothetical protein
VSVCGEIAADPIAAPLLIGLGVDSLSVPSPAVAVVKQAIRWIDSAQASTLATQALYGASAARSVRLLPRVEDAPPGVVLCSRLRLCPHPPAQNGCGDAAHGATLIAGPHTAERGTLASPWRSNIRRSTVK